jgi:NitT/TauT family transport system substrate-binding protein
MITRRAFLGGMTATLATARSVSAEPRPETKRIRLLKNPSICWAPQYVAEDLLHAEGFSEVAYVPNPPTTAISTQLAAGEADLGMNFVGPNIVRIDAGDPVVFLGGAHVGCFEAFASDRIRRVHELKGKTVAVTALNSAHHVFFTTILAHVGLDPRRDVRWLSPEGDRRRGSSDHAENPLEESMRMFVEGRADAFLGFPPQPQELRARKVGHVLVNSATDRPWSQYFCCLLTASKAFVAKNPVATKRALRAILKSADICASDPERAAQALVNRGFAANNEYALQTMRELPYGKWREYDPEDTIRFYALRLHEVGMIKATPQKIIAQATEWRFLNELKQELKG